MPHFRYPPSSRQASSPHTHPQRIATAGLTSMELGTPSRRYGVIDTSDKLTCRTVVQRYDCSAHRAAVQEENGNHLQGKLALYCRSNPTNRHKEQAKLGLNGLGQLKPGKKREFFCLPPKRVLCFPYGHRLARPVFAPDPRSRSTSCERNLGDSPSQHNG